MRILIVDDNDLNLSVLSQQITLLGYDYDTAVNGNDAYAKSKAHRHPLVLTDCQMPEADGFQLARSIRALEAQNDLAPVPIIAISANALADEAKRCFQSGMDDYLIKPVKLKELKTVLAKWGPRRDNPKAPQKGG